MAKPSQSLERGSSRRMRWREAVLALLKDEQTPGQVATQLGVAPWTAREIVKDLQRDRLVTQLARGRYIRVQPGVPIEHGPLQLIRDQLLDYLSEPRQVADVASQIKRSSSVVTGHLNRLRHQGAVVRVEYGVYVRSDRCTASDHIDGSSPERSPLDDVLAELLQEKSITALCQKLLKSERQIRRYLRALVQDRLIECVGKTGFRQVQPNLFPDGKLPVKGAPG